ncbi:DNA-binding transcriptional LysR family regulator [Xanthomonas translucens]
MKPHPTLDQLEVFVAVVEHGGFSAASRALHRTQSVVSYTVANLEAQLGLALFQRSGTRRPQLTDAGRSVLEDARRLMGDLDLLRSRLKALDDGLEGELGVAISNAVPSDIVVAVLRAFRERYPTVSLNVTVGTLGTVIEAVVSGKAVLGFGGAMDNAGRAVVTERIGWAMTVPVAAPGHPLGRLGRVLQPADVRDDTQIVVYDASGLTKGRDFNVFSLRTWRVSDNATKRLFIRNALGWGGLPESLVREDLADGRLVRLVFPAFDQGKSPIYAIRSAVNPPGPAARWLTEETQRQFRRLSAE